MAKRSINTLQAFSEKLKLLQLQRLGLWTQTGGSVRAYECELMDRFLFDVEGQIITALQRSFSASSLFIYMF